MKSSIFILGFVLCVSGTTYGQSISGENMLDRFYFKAGAEFSSLSRSVSGSRGDANDINLVGSVIYDYFDNAQLEFVYKYGFDRGYLISEDSYRNGNAIIFKSENEDLTDYNVDLKLNYFLNHDKTINPVYVAGLLELDIQNRSHTYNESHDDTGRYIQTFYNFKKSSYNRVLFGPGVGAGIFLAFGKINFQAEAATIMRVAPFVDRGYRELLVNVSAALVYKF